MSFKALLKSLAALYLLAAASLGTHAFATQTSPLFRSELSNGDYLNHIYIPPEEPSLNTRIFGPISREMSTKYQSFSNTYYERQQYGLNTMESEIQFQSATRDMLRWTFHRALQENVTLPVKRFAWRSLREQIHAMHEEKPETRTTAGSATPDDSADADTSKSSASTGRSRPFSTSHGDFFQTVTYYYNSGFDLGNNARARFQYDMPSGTMDLALTNPYVSASMDYLLPPIDFNMSNGLTHSNNVGNRMMVSLNKSISEFGLSTGMHYGLITRAMSYGVTKNLLGPLSTAVDQSRSTMQVETTYRLNLGLAF